MKTENWINRCIVTGLMMVSMVAIAGCSGHRVLVRSFPPEDMLHIDQLRTMDGVESLSSRVVYVDKGDTIPLALSLESDFMAFKQDEIDIVAKQKLYFMIRMPENMSKEEIAELNQIDAQTLNEWSGDQRKAFIKKYMIYVSRDAVHWAPLSSVSALREVLDYKTGLVSFGMAAGTSHGLGASLSIKTVR